MHKISVCIPTYKRPLLLEKLILSIVENGIDALLIKDLNIIVVDNDSDKSAEAITNELKQKFFNKYELEYYNCPVKGLSKVRNELFKYALENHPDYIVCIDDDEYPVTEWLNELVKTISVNNGDIVMGPVVPEFEAQVLPYLSHYFNYRDIKDNERLYYFASGNFIIDSKFLLKHDLHFDDRFNTTGAEDSYFGVIALKHGARIFGASRAISYELISKKKGTLEWLIKRRFRGAITFTYMLILEKEYFKVLKKTAISAIYIFAGTIGLIFILFPFKHRYWGLLKIAESVGGFVALLNIKFHQYH